MKLVLFINIYAIKTDSLTSVIFLPREECNQWKIKYIESTEERNKVEDIKRWNRTEDQRAERDKLPKNINRVKH